MRTLYSACLSGANYISGAARTATEWICNHQSSANDSVIWIAVPGNHPVQFFARSGSNRSYGTDPVCPS
ncbi:hypothetical protein BIV25_36760 [Streptomyces sp. MUSC 14]|uniref:hypothetical protein n=1 Tax=Streptomyces sp. MUSC 14 TaxID=1354889 RepID=UPI0008F5C01F|nr:hypothetical protein [Streptomyces sp. MUSC 14]OIJ88711.1 hypothetical protein BIV25_36760 [Streptomyces sp. MUSC 14]